MAKANWVDSESANAEMVEQEQRKVALVETSTDRNRFRLPGTFTALRHRNFRLFYIGQLISLIGSWMQNTAQGWLVVLLATPGATLAAASHGTATGGEAQANLYLGIISTAGSLPILFGSLYGGVIADRYSKRGIIVLTQAAQMVIALLMAALILLGHVQIWHVILGAFLFGVVNVFDIPARQAFVFEMVGKQDLPNAIALNSSIFNAARAFGPAIAGIIIALLHGKNEEYALAQCFLYNGLSYIAVITGLLMMRGTFRPGNVNTDSQLTQLREVIQYLRVHRSAMLLIVLVAIYSICIAPYFILLPSLARFTLHENARNFGFLMSCQGIGALAGALTIATLSRYPHKGAILMGAALTFPTLLVALAFNRVFLISCVLVVIIGFTMICFLATANTLLQTSVPDSLRGRIMGVYSLILMGLTPIGSLWAAGVARVAGAPTAIALGAVLVGAVVFYSSIRYPHFRQMRDTLPQELS